MRGKQALSFLLMRPAFTRSNISTVGIVALFVGVYSIFGGKVTSNLPTVKQGSTFGSVVEEDLQQQDLQGLGDNGNDVPAEPVRSGEDRAEAQGVIGVLPTDAEKARMQEIDKRGRLFDASTPEEDGEDGKPINREGLVKGVDFKSHRDEWIMLRSEKRKADGLAAIEDRLQMKRARKKKAPASTGDPN